MPSGRIRVEVVYAAPDRQTLIALEVSADTTVGGAIDLSGIRSAYPEIVIPGMRVGIFGKLAQLDAVLVEGDRVEIYRPLVADPKESRRRRVGSGKLRRRAV